MKLLSLLLLATLAEPALAAAAPARGPTLEARALYDRAQRRLARGGAEQRQAALLDLERAARLDPQRPAYALGAGRLCLQADLLHQARHWAGEVLVRDSSSADAHRLLGETWRRDWLITADEDTRDRAIIHLSRAARLSPARCDTWLLLAPLLVEVGELRDARLAAETAWEADSARAECWLLRAATAQRTGDLEQADEWFETALRRLPGALRESFEDPTPLLAPAMATQLKDMKPRERARFRERFWKSSDPDLVTPWNEGRLEFLSRATQAYFLYWQRALGGWDTRGDLYVRFGPPTWSDRNPAFRPNYVDVSGQTWLVWGYPELGMRIWMGATNPLGIYRLPLAVGGKTAAPFPDSLANRRDLVPVGGGWAVFSRLPPGASLLALDCALARFQGEKTPRLLAQAECPGSFGDSLSVDWVVLDTLSKEVARAGRLMSASACSPTESRAAGFTADLLPGRYRVGVRVRDTHGGQGVFSGDAALGEARPALGLSDVVVTCGEPQTAFLAGEGLRLDPEPRGKASRRDQLHAYFEIYRLTPGPDGSARFQYVYTVRSAEKDRRIWIERMLSPRRAPAPIVASREEETVGPVRRQFITIPVRGLPDGNYELEVRVRDLVAGGEAVATAQFLRGD